jgi:hypothetical protein
MDPTPAFIVLGAFGAIVFVLVVITNPDRPKMRSDMSNYSGPGAGYDSYWIQGGKHGGYRNTRSTVYGSAAQATHQATTHAALAAAQAQAAAQANALAQARAGQSPTSVYPGGLTLYQEPDPPTVENTGIELGEVEAWRAWRVEHGWLYSMTNDAAEWEPGKPMEAHKVGLPMGEGIHAFKTRKQALTEYEGVPFHIVVGRVLLWGDVVEFTKGWHAEFAAVGSLEWSNSAEIDMAELRRTYELVEEK